MLDSLMLALSVAVASTHLQAREVEAPEPVAYASTTAVDRRDDAEAMVVRLNRVRAAAGLAALREDPALSAVAVEHAREMVRERYFGHRNPEGLTLAARFARRGLSARLIGENLAWCADGGEAARDLWQSPGHRANERDARFGRVGVAALRTGDDGVLYVQLFTE